jgi:hypothetical protein
MKMHETGMKTTAMAAAILLGLFLTVPTLLAMEPEGMKSDSMTMENAPMAPDKMDKMGNEMGTQGKEKKKSEMMHKKKMKKKETMKKGEMKEGEMMMKGDGMKEKGMEKMDETNMGGMK